MNISLIANLKELLADQKQSIVITTHTNPDGDAIGSSLGLYAVLKNIGFTNVSVITPNAYPSFLHWLPNHNSVINAELKPVIASELIARAKIIFCLDLNGLNRTDQLEKNIKQSSAAKVMVDHHPQPENGFDIIFSDIHASSTAEIVYEIIEKLGYGREISLDAAQCIYAGIVTDTGSFSFSCNNPRTYEITAELIRKGVDGSALQGLIYSANSLNRVRLLGFCLSEKLQVIEGHKTAYISLTKNDLKKYKYQEGDAEGFVNYALGIEGIIFAAFFVEKDDHIKVSLRSTGSFDVNIFARKYFNGGGHLNASGGKSYETLSNTLKGFENIVRKVVC